MRSTSWKLGLSVKVNSEKAPQDSEGIRKDIKIIHKISYGVDQAFILAVKFTYYFL